MGGPKQLMEPPNAPRMFHRVMDATLVNVRRALEDLRARFNGGAEADALDRLELVLAEVLNNITLHGAGGLPPAGALTEEGRAADILPMRNFGHSGPAPKEPQSSHDDGVEDGVVIHLTVTQHSGGLACAVVDNGTPLPKECLVFPKTFPSPEACAIRAGGFGWFIIRDLTRSLFYFRENSRNVLCFNIPRRDARPSGHSAMGAA